jgi:hypothetical protein
MKKLIILMIALLITGFQLMAQDIVYFKNGNQQKGKVLEISANEIVYKKAENPDGPAYTSYKSDVQMIEYSNGYKEVFAQSNSNNNSGSNQSNNNNNQQAQNGNGGGNTYQNNNYYPSRPNVNVNINPIWGGGYYGGGAWGWGGPVYYGGWGGAWGWGGRGYYGGGWGGGYHHHHHHH